MLFDKIFGLFSKKAELQKPDVIALPREKLEFSHKLNEWIVENNHSVLLLDSDVLDFLKVNSIDFDYSWATLVVVWDSWVIIGSTYARDGRYAIITKFITKSPHHHGVVYKNDINENYSTHVKAFKLEETQ